MIEVKIDYRPWWMMGLRKELRGSFPEGWEELTGKQLIGVACLLKGTVTDIGFLHVMTGIKKRVLKQLDQYERFKLLQLFNKFNEPRPYHEFILKSLVTGKHTLVAPKAKMKGVTFGQFIFADTYFGSYQDGGKLEDLHKFVASVYLPEGVKFDEKLIDENFVKMNDVEMVKLEAIAINYQLIREWLGLAYPLVFLKEEESKEQRAEGKEQRAKKEDKKKYDPMGWIKVFDGLVGDDIVSHDKYADMPMHNVFRYMTNRIKENMKRKK